MDEASAFVANNPEELGPDCLPTYGGRSMRVKKNVDHAGVVLAHSKKDFALLRTAFERHARALSSDAASGRDHMGLTPRYFPLHAHIASMTVISSFPALLNS
jgi:hypothetical protein